MPIRPTRNNPQFQPLTTVLKNIIRDYQAGGGILLELCQNADDAGASEIEFVLDRREHTTRDILHPGLAEYQGISLLAYNNTTFTEKDFLSLGKIGDSEKKDELESTGKFGRGFNSVYNWTDSPSILSGSSLLILDPHQTWSATPEVNNPGGPVYDFVKHSFEPEMRNQLSAFGSVLKNFDAEFDGTIIRLPLRTKAQAAKSKIRKKPTLEKDVIEVFSTFSAELVEPLLFLKNLNKITVRIGDDVYARAKSEFEEPSTSTAEPSTAKARKKRKKQNKHREKAAVNTAYQRVYVDKADPSCKMNFVMNISLYRYDLPGPEQKFRYAISHNLAQGPKDQELQEWASRNKHFPWTAIAAPLEIDTVFKGGLFNTLPLPIHTNHPVHIHGMFSTTSDRRRIYLGAGGDWMVGQDSEAKLGAKWNQWLFSECVPQTWIQNLEFLQGMSERGEFRFSGWEFWPAGSDEVWGERGMRVLGDVFERVVREGRKLLPTVCGTTERRHDVLFYLDVLGVYEFAFRDAGLAVVVSPQDRIYELERLDPYNLLTPLDPSSVRNRLTLKDNLGGLPLTSRQRLLYYIILDKNFEEINLCRAPLIPVKDGTFESFRVYGQHSPSIFLARNNSEVEIFGEYSGMIDISKLLPEAAQMMQESIEELHENTRISKLTVDSAAWYCDRYIFNQLEHREADIIRKEGLNQFVDRLWNWISQECKPVSESHSPLRNLWLLPLMNEEYRKLDSNIPVLDVSIRRGIGEFIWKAANSHQQSGGAGYALFSGDGVSSLTAEHLKRCGYIKDCEDIAALMTWLVANSEGFVDRLSDKEKAKLLEHLGGLSGNCFKNLKKFMGDMVSKLRIFKEATPMETVERDWISMSGVDSLQNPVKYVGVKNIPVILRTPDTVFIDVENGDTLRLIQRLRMAECPTERLLFEHYVVPEIASTINYKLRLPLIEYTLQKFHTLSAKCKSDLSDIDFVQVSGTSLKCPRDTIDPGSVTASLFFPDENRVASEELFKRYRYELLELGVVSLISEEMVLERILEYGKPGRLWKDIAEKAQQLIINYTGPLPLPERIRHLRWIPAQSLDGTQRLYNANECRHRKSESLVKYAMPLVDIPVNNAWAIFFGWDQPPPRTQILQQLNGAVNEDDLTALEYLVKHEYISAEQFPELKNIRWIPSITEIYYSATNIYLEDFSSLSPHFGTLNPRFQRYTNLFSKIGVQLAPPFRQLKEFQDALAAKGTLEELDLKMALSVVKEVGRRHSKKKGLCDFKVPDKTGRMCAISELTTENPVNQGINLKILHPDISLDTAKKLGLPTFQDRYLELLNDPHYERTLGKARGPRAAIEDTLRSCSINDTFAEYLANAEYCGSASVIHWILDESDDYPKENLLSPGLEKVQGPALFCYNDGMFSPSDFSRITGIGSRLEHGYPSKTGGSGKGVLTMYHWTSVPSFISGDCFVIFDPDQRYLPEQHITKKPRAGMKIKIGDVRNEWPEQLRPFEGISGFDKESTSFPGTLFRFPFPTRGKVSMPEAREYLESYYEDANTSLLFLKNISSISFFDKNSNNANWSVNSSADPKVEKSHISCLRIIGEYPSSPNRSVSREWCIVSRGQSVAHGLAALISEMPMDGSSTRKFVGPMLQLSGDLEFPVYMNANMIPQNSQQSMSATQLEESLEWNKQIDQVTSLYLDLVQYITKIKGTNGYRYWPKIQPQDARAVSDDISRAFWNEIPTSTHSLYIPDGISALGGTDIGHTTKVLSLKEATFNLLDTKTRRDFFSSLLLELGLENIVTADEKVRNGLREILPASMVSITSNFIIGLFRDSPGRSLKIWGQEHNSSIHLFNSLLDFLIDKTPPSSLIDCTLLPLANSTLGLFLPRSTSPVHFVAETLEENEILGIFEDLGVHPELKCDVTERLLMDGSLNIKRFQLDDLIELHQKFDSEERGIEHRKGWLVKAWKYLKLKTRCDPGAEQNHLSHLKDKPIYFGRVVGEPIGHCVFLRPSEFDDFTHPAILEPLRPTTVENTVIESLKGLILLDRSAFQESNAQEWIRGVSGVYRLLKSIECLASRDGSLSTGAYILKTIHPDSIAALRSIISPQIVSELLIKYPESGECLKQLPLWPVTNPRISTHKTATEALLPPYANLSSLGMMDNVFIDANVVEEYSEQLVKLGAEKMALDCFLRSHIGVFLGRQISEDKRQYYESLIGELSIVCPKAFSEYPLGIDGSNTFRMLDSLYSLDEPIFEAAFRDLEMTHFLHQDFRHLPSWKRSPLLQKITENSYLACAHSIQRRERKSEAQDDRLVDDARIVFDYLCRNDLETQKWSSTTWRDISEIPFVPVKTDFTDYHHHRISTMKTLLKGRKLAAITDAIVPGYIDFSWSQYPVLEKSMCPSVLGKLPTLSAKTALNHLRFLSDNRHNVLSTEIQAYVGDIKAVYRYLQEHLGSAGEFPVTPTARIWFNVEISEIPDMSIGVFQESWECSQSLRMGLEFDSLLFRRVRSLLTPYQNLMRSFHVREVKAPTSTSLCAHANHTSLILNGLQKLREEGSTLDVKLVLEDREFGAHRAVLCAVSKYWNKIFSGTERTYTFPTGSTVKPETVSVVLDYIYTGHIESGPIWEDLTKILGQLYLSSEWGLDELKAELEASLCQNGKYWIRPESVLDILKCAEEARAETLAGICNKYISDNHGVFE